MNFVGIEGEIHMVFSAQAGGWLKEKAGVFSYHAGFSVSLFFSVADIVFPCQNGFGTKPDGNKNDSGTHNEILVNILLNGSVNDKKRPEDKTDHPKNDLCLIRNLLLLRF